MIKIQVLDYKYGIGLNNIVNFNNVTNAEAAWTIDSPNQITASSASGTDYIYPVSGNLTDGVEYTASITLASKTGGNNIGFSTNDANGNDIGWGSSAPKGTVNGVYTHTFTAAGYYAPRIFAGDSTTGIVTASITPTSSIDFNESVVGTLDVGDSEDFPLSMNFSVADARNLNSRTGTYSKTFKIPATKNNNRIFKYSYNEGYKLDNNTISNQKKCRIQVDDTLFIEGLIQVTAIGKSREPAYYSCVFYGNNVGWAASLEGKLLKDLSVIGGANGSGWDNLNDKGSGTGTGLKNNREGIIQSWRADNAVFQTTAAGVTSANNQPIVYPIVGYGENNAGGAEGKIQLLKNAYDAGTGGTSAKIGFDGWFNSGDEYPTPTPSMDWRPAIFIYDIVKQLFKQEGYSIVSNFIETDMFKSLLMLLPNFIYNNVDERINDNSIFGSFKPNTSAYIGRYNFLTAAVPNSPDIWKEFTITWNGDNTTGTDKFVTTGQPSMYVDSSGFFTAKEYGFYDISMSNIGGWLSSVCDGDATNSKVRYIKIACQVRTAGQTSFNTVENGESFGIPFDDSRNYDCPSPDITNNKGFDFPDLNVENQWLNKNDTVRFRIVYRMSHGDSTDKTIGWDVYLFGGSNVPNGGGNSDANGAISVVLRGERSEYGQTFDLKNVIDSSSTQMGFMRGIIHAFNLQFTTDLASKTVSIEPFNDFYKEQSEAVDWTNKIDLSRTQEDKWVQGEIRREVVFKYKTDSNDKVVEHRGQTLWDGILDENPYREFAGTEFPVGEVVFENPFFSGCYNSQDGQTNAGAASTNATPFRANLWGLCDTGNIPTPNGTCRPPKGYNFQPRLLNYVKSSVLPTAGITPIRFAAGTQWWGATDLQSLIAGAPSNNFTYPFLCYANSADGFTLSNFPRKPLTYGSVEQKTYNAVGNSIGSSVIYKGLYQEYYQNMIEQIKTNPRIKTVYVNLKLSDINNLDLRKLVYIDGYYYRINQIMDYNPNNNEITKVELILWEYKGSFVPKLSF